MDILSKIPQSKWSKPTEFEDPTGTSDSGWKQFRTWAGSPQIIVGPPKWEVFTCMSCKFGRGSKFSALPVKARDQRYHAWCSYGLSWKTGLLDKDNGCKWWRPQPATREFKRNYEGTTTEGKR